MTASIFVSIYVLLVQSGTFIYSEVGTPALGTFCLSKKTLRKNCLVNCLIQIVSCRRIHFCAEKQTHASFREHFCFGGESCGKLSGTDGRISLTKTMSSSVRSFNVRENEIIGDSRQSTDWSMRIERILLKSTETCQFAQRRM